MYKIYCDGACSGNPGKGAWAYVVFDENLQIFCGSGYEDYTTNNRMELTAAIKALHGFNDCELILDSKYVKNGITDWINKWKSQGWKTTKGAVKNLDLWQELDQLAQIRNVKWSWQKGHSNSLHDYADELARKSIIQSLD